MLHLTSYIFLHAIKRKKNRGKKKTLTKKKTKKKNISQTIKYQISNINPIETSFLLHDKLITEPIIDSS